MKIKIDSHLSSDEMFILDRYIAQLESKTADTRHACDHMVKECQYLFDALSVLKKIRRNGSDSK